MIMRTRSIRSVRSVVTAALGCLMFFPAAVIALQVIQADDYSIASQAMSELALGKAGWLMTLAFLALGSGTVLLGISIRVSLPRARVLFGCLLLAGALDVVSAIFRTNGAGPETTSSSIHQLAGLSTFVLITTGMFASVRTFRRDAAWRSFAFPTLAWAAASVATFFLVPIIGDANFGVAQRIFVAVWLSWLIVLAARLRNAPSTESAISEYIPQRQVNANE